MTREAGVPTVSVIAATCGRPENLAQLVPTVLAEAVVRHFVVVVDGEDAASMEVLAALARHHDRLVFEQVPRGGQLRALEAGLVLTDAEVVVLLDDDVFPTPGLAEGHARGHAGSGGLVLVGPMPVDLPERGADIGSRLYASDYQAQLARVASGACAVLEHLWLGNVSLRRADALAVGLYAERFTASYHADRDLGLRLAAAGLVGRYDPTLGALHRHRSPNRRFLQDARRRGAGLEHMHAVHPELGPFDPAVFTDDLPAPVASAVGRIGRTRAAPSAARALLATSGLVGRLGADGGRVALAKLARRVMHVWGSVAGEGPRTGGAAAQP